MPEIEDVEFAVTAEDFVAALAIEQYRNAPLSRGLHDTPLRIHACSSKRLVLMPDQTFQIVPETLPFGENQVRSQTCRRDDLTDERSFVQGFELEAGRKRVQLRSRNRRRSGHYYGRRVETATQARAHGHVATQVSIHGFGE